MGRGGIRGDGKVFFHTPRESDVALGEFSPKFFPSVLDIWQDYSEDFPATNQAVIPAEVVVEQQIEGGRLTCAQRLNGPLLDFGFEAAAAHRTFDAAIRVENCFCTDLLRARAFDAGDDPQRDWFAVTRGLREFLEYGVLHAVR